MVESQFHSTTICAVEKNGKFAMAGDGQVTMGESVVMKGTARKVRRIYNDEVVVGFAGSVADAFTLEEKFEGKLNEYNGNLQRAAVELAQEWRTQQSMQKLEAMLIVMNDKEMLQMAGKGCIMQNAHQLLKDLLPDMEVIGSNVDDAVAHYLRKLYQV